MARALPRTSLGELTALSQTPLAVFEGAAGEGRGREGRKRGRRGREGKGREGKWTLATLRTDRRPMEGGDGVLLHLPTATTLK